MSRTQDVTITKILDDPKNWRYFLDVGGGQHLFTERRPIYSFIDGYYRQYGVIPAEDFIVENFPGWERTEHEAPFEYWVDKLRDDRNILLQNSAVEKFLSEKKKETDPKKLSEIFIKLALDLSNNSSTRDISMLNSDSEKEDYLEKKEKGGMRGIPLGILPFDLQTGGMQDGDLGIIFGPPENMKTWLLLMAAHYAWSEYDEPILIISKEMSAKDMRNRLSWFDVRVPYSMFEKGTLGVDLEKRYFERLAERTQSRNECIVSADEGDFDKGGGVSQVAAKIDKYKPSAVFIDGAYLISDDRGDSNWQGTRNVFRDLKRLARQRNLPVLATAQPQRLKDPKTGDVLRRKLTMEDVGGSYTIAQDSDFMIGVRKMMSDERECVINVYKIKMRRGTGFDTQIRIGLSDGNIQTLREDETIAEEDMQTESEVLLYD